MKTRKNVLVAVSPFATTEKRNRFKNAKVKTFNPMKSKTSAQAGKDFEEFLYFNGAVEFYNALKKAFNDRP